MKKWIVLCVSAILLLSACSNNEEATKQANTNEATENNNETTTNELTEETIVKGEEGDAVPMIQQALIDIGYDVEETGVLDSYTVWALTDMQLQLEDIATTGIYDKAMKQVIEEQLDQTTVEPAAKLDRPDSNDHLSLAIDNPYEVLALVNKSNALPEGFEPEDLTVPDVRFPFEEDDPKKQLRKVAADALEELFEASEAEGLNLFAQSGYRSYDRQVAVFAANVEKHGEEHANTYSARPGESEHQTGLVMDVTTDEVGFDLIVEFGETDEGKWLKDNAHKYGFIIRYPEGKEDITKYQYEPWHLRYVGEQAATEIYEKEMTLEEYLEAKQ